MVERVISTGHLNINCEEGNTENSETSLDKTLNPLGKGCSADCTLTV
jgi:hypothetical protein